ncbi:endospore germination permease [Paenibacillus sp. NEAU-GSW1]|nr:endospore germination permease [Paenibacillus sp. NEAU-GSW1]
MWFVMYQLGSAFLVLPSTLATVAKQDAWLSIVIVIGLQMLMIGLYAAIATKLNNQSLQAYMASLLGKWLGNAVLFLFIACYPFFIFMLVLRDLSDFLTTSVFPETPSEAVYALMLIAVVYIVRCGVSTIGRAAELFFFFVLTLFVLGYFSLLPSANLDNLKPVFEFGWKPIVQASLTLIGFPYVESVIFLFFGNQLDKPGKWKIAVRRASLISGSMFLIMTVIVIAVLNEGVISNLTYPSYFTVRTINIADFYERFEVIVALLWYITIFFRLSLLLYVSSTGIATIFRLKNHYSLLIPLALIGYSMGNAMWPNKAVVISAFPIWAYYSMIFGILFPLFIWLADKVKGGFASKTNQ